MRRLPPDSFKRIHSKSKIRRTTQGGYHLAGKPSCRSAGNQGLSAGALVWIRDLEPNRLQALHQAALKTAGEFSMRRTADKALEYYQALLSGALTSKTEEDAAWERVLSLIKVQWEITRGLTEAAGTALRSGEPPVAAGWKDRRHHKKIS